MLIVSLPLVHRPKGVLLVVEVMVGVVLVLTCGGRFRYDGVMTVNLVNMMVWLLAGKEGGFCWWV